MKVSVIMPSKLGDYPNAATDRQEKFIRAIKSFLDQNYQDKELVIIEDDCQITIDLYKQLPEIFYPYGKAVLEDVKLLSVKKKSKDQRFSGVTRTAGIKHCEGQVITYLDTDDLFLPYHLAKIMNEFIIDEILRPDWVYFNDYAAISGNFSENRERDVILQEGRIGTSNIAHLYKKNLQWPNGYGHDWKFIENLINKFPNFKKVFTPGYLVCHIPDQIDY